MNNIRKLVLAAAIAAMAWPVLAVPSIDAVQAQVAQGHYAQAEEMMREVVSAKPDSARAHYVYAEVLAHDGRYALAADEAARARSIDPQLTFTDPSRFKAFTGLLDREQAGAHVKDGVRPTASAGSGGAPMLPASGGTPAWVWGAGAAALAWAAWRAMAVRNATAPQVVGAAMPAGMAAGAQGGYGATGSFAQAPAWPPAAAVAQPAPAMTGGSLLGTGLAVAGGVAAGMLAERMLEGHREAAPVFLSSAAPAAGLVPGMFDDDATDAARALQERPIDMGAGDGWGGGGDAASAGDGW